MGGRGNIQVIGDGGASDSVWLYSHWSGSNLPTILKSALARGRSRWSNPSYLARIIFSEMLLSGGDSAEAELKCETGFGISAHRLDGGTDISVNCREQVVSWKDKRWTFEGYVGRKKAPKY